MAKKPITKSRPALSTLKKSAGVKKSSSSPASRAATGDGEPAAVGSDGVPRFSGVGFDKIAVTREVFWQNVMRELLTSLSILCAQREAARQKGAQELDGGAQNGVVSAAVSPGGVEGSVPAKERGGRAVRGLSASDEPEGRGDDSPSPSDGEGEHDIPRSVGADPANIFDGRLAVITSLGQRVPIAEVHPVFGCGVRGKSGSNLLSSIVECTVFEIRTPGGEVYTIPIHEVKAFHALTPELVEEIAQSVRGEKEAGGGEVLPFGFAAFTSLARSGDRLSDVPELDREFIGE